MYPQKALDAIAKEKLIQIRDSFFGLVNGRLSLCIETSTENEFRHTPTEIGFNEFLVLVDNHNTFNIIERPIILDEHMFADPVYDFSILVEHICHFCLTEVTHTNAIKEGKYAYCPGCGNRFFKALRLDGVREDILPEKKQPKVNEPRNKKEEVQEPDLDALFNSENTKKYSKRVAIIMPNEK